MRMLLKSLAALAAATSCSLPALAYESLIGEYEGSVKGVIGYSKQEGDACAVKISKSDLYGGSVSFAISGVDEVLFETHRVSEALGAGGREVKLTSPGGTGKDNEIVFMKLGTDGAMKFLKLTRKRQTAQHTERPISCGDLTRK
jgi:hypothetical protein